MATSTAPEQNSPSYRPLFLEPDNTKPSVDPTPPVATHNCLGNVLGWLKAGDQVQLFNSKSSEILSFRIPNTPSARLIRIDTSNVPDVMLDGEWPGYIENYTKACRCEFSADTSMFYVYTFHIPKIYS